MADFDFEARYAELMQQESDRHAAHLARGEAVVALVRALKDFGFKRQFLISMKGDGSGKMRIESAGSVVLIEPSLDDQFVLTFNENGVTRDPSKFDSITVMDELIRWVFEANGVPSGV